MHTRDAVAFARRAIESSASVDRVSVGRNVLEALVHVADECVNLAIECDPGAADIIIRSYHRDLSVALGIADDVFMTWPDMLKRVAEIVRSTPASPKPTGNLDDQVPLFVAIGRLCREHGRKLLLVETVPLDHTVTSNRERALSLLRNCQAGDGWWFKVQEAIQLLTTPDLDREHALAVLQLYTERVGIENVAPAIREAVETLEGNRR